MELNLKGKPFYLEEDQVAWVNETYESMSLTVHGLGYKAVVK